MSHVDERHERSKIVSEAAVIDRGERLLKLRDVQDKTGISRATIYTRMGQGIFPRPLNLGPGAVRWKESEIEAWIRSLPRA